MSRAKPVIGLTLASVGVWFLSATGFAQAVRDGDRPTARAAPARAAARPAEGAGRDRASTQPVAPAEGRGRGGFAWSRHDRTPPAARAPGDDLFRAGPFTYAPRFDRLSRSFHPGHKFSNYGYLSGYYFPSYFAPVPPTASVYPSAPGAYGDTPGYLELEVQPGTAQVFIDGSYLGTVDDFRGPGAGVALEAGPHRVEIRSEGFEAITFDVRILPNETIAYRNDLVKRADRPEPVSPTVRGPAKTLYVIPRCYAGDTPPRAEQLPAGCDPTRVRTVR